MVDLSSLFPLEFAVNQGSPRKKGHRKQRFIGKQRQYLSPSSQAKRLCCPVKDGTAVLLIPLHAQIQS
ncbi:hypothetical protein A3849_17020 [Paenibacillus sp. P46E]|nr:hypothetical protein A3849_17020 [Paenibacillus sp. P46E]